MVSPEGTQGRNRMSAVTPSAVVPPSRVHSGETHDGKNAGYWPQIVAAAAAKSPQSCPTLWDPRDGSPPGSPVPGILVNDIHAEIFRRRCASV